MLKSYKRKTYAVLGVSTKDAIDAARNRMAKSVYPIGLDDCEVVGLNGGCGDECLIFKAGKCPAADPPNTSISGQSSSAVIDGKADEHHKDSP